jgi:2-keto-4-pentenoate hydratase/2-oxohepta-3-ene-1,7-dioic acid hydratase in catechol pathway
MSALYRLAVVEQDRGAIVIVERGGRFVPLVDLLTGEGRASLGDSAPRDLMPLLGDWDRWDPLLAGRVEAKADLLAKGSATAGLRFLPPVALPNKLICIGANYHDHVAEMPIPMTPTYPYSFLKPASTTLRGSGVAVAKPAISQMMDWEAELAVVIGTAARDVSANNALGIVAGYANFNDLSARDWVANRPPIGVDWVLHKAFDGFAPMGPYFVPARFVPEPQDLPIRLSVNGVVKQDSNTSEMIYGVRAIIEHLTKIMTLEPGDVIATGTPAGVGNGRKPPEFLQPGDEVRMEIGACGELVTPIV